MKKEYIPFGDQMKMEVAFSTAVGACVAPGSKIVWLAGQLAYDENDVLVGKGDIGAQTEQIIKNLSAALEKFGGTLDDVVNVTVYVKEMTGLREIHEARLKYFKKPYPASTLVQVAELVNPDALLEINAQAVIKGQGS